MDTWIERTCRQRSLAQAIRLGALGAIPLAGAAAILIGGRETLSGPHPVELADVAKARVPSEIGHEFVSIDSSGARDTGVAEIRTENGREKSRTPVWAVPVGEKFLLVKASRKPGSRIEGTVGNLRSDLAQELVWHDRRTLLPFLLVEGDPRSVLWALASILAALGALLGFLAARAARRRSDPMRHRAFAALAADGNLAELSSQIEAELAAPDVLHFRKWALTRSFVLDQSGACFEVLRWRDLVWAHKFVTKRSVYFIPVAQTIDPVFCFSPDRRLQFPSFVLLGTSADAAGVDEVLALAAERAPWAVHGWDAGIEHQWRKSRAALCDAIAQRRAELTANQK